MQMKLNQSITEILDCINCHNSHSQIKI